LAWDFLQPYDESWIWRRAERFEVTESARNFAALDECIADAVRYGYVPPDPGARSRRAQARGRALRASKSRGFAPPT